MPKIDITGTRGEVNFADRSGKMHHGESSMDEIVVGVTREGRHPVALSFEDVQDMALLTIDLTSEQAENLAKALEEMVAFCRERQRQSTNK